jgi:hypothetical protein
VGGKAVNIVLLLPAFARQRLYTFPLPPERGPSLGHDCIWTAFNFFAEEPVPLSFANLAEVVKTLDRDYYHVYTKPQLGDLVVYLGEGGKLIHAAVYVADDVLFTKIGNTPSWPWMLIKMDEMKTFYPSHKPWEVKFYRHREL